MAHVLCQEDLLCRDSWVGHISEDDFTNLACAKCYVQVFFDQMPLTLQWPPVPPYKLVHRLEPNLTFHANAVQSSAVCEATLTTEECARWQECCHTSVRCCQDNPYYGNQSDSVRRCPATWDGVACWPATRAGSMATQGCPNYYHSTSSSWTKAVVARTCTGNGTWAVHPDHGTEMTDYTSCFDSTDTTYILKVSLLIDVIGHALSILSLSLAVGVITCSRSLRRDFLSRDSLRLHLNLFVAMLGLGISTLAFCYIFYDGIIHPASPIYMANPVWCRVLYTFTTYFRGTAYMAMFSEGLSLYRRISNMMRVNVREPTGRYFIITWGVPVITTAAYVITRVVLRRDKRCWIAEGFSELELIYMVPNIISLVCNIGFLIGIEYNLCTTMTGGDASDRRSKVLRHALRATLSLVPVFGLQFLFIVYRPSNWPPYEIMAALLTSTQGFLVSIVYCFSTKEVRQELTPTCTRLLRACGICGCCPCSDAQYSLASKGRPSCTAETEVTVRQTTHAPKPPHLTMTTAIVDIDNGPPVDNLTVPDDGHTPNTDTSCVAKDIAEVNTASKSDYDQTPVDPDNERNGGTTEHIFDNGKTNVAEVSCSNHVAMDEKSLLSD